MNQNTINNLSGKTSGDQEPKLMFRDHFEAFGHICGLSETGRATHWIEGCASVVSIGWHSNKKTSRALCGSLWTILSDVERGRDQYIY